jgi:predicted amidohydrolase
MATSKKAIIAVCQMTAKNIVEDNFKTCQNLIEMAAEKKAQVSVPTILIIVPPLKFNYFSLAGSFSP